MLLQLSSLKGGDGRGHLLNQYLILTVFKTALADLHRLDSKLSSKSSKTAGVQISSNGQWRKGSQAALQ